MAEKTANILARFEPGIKEQAESILPRLGIPASVVINMLYKQIIMQREIPFTLSVASTPMTRDEMDNTMFNTTTQRGLDEAKDDRSRSVAEVFSELGRKI